MLQPFQPFPSFAYFARYIRAFSLFQLFTCSLLMYLSVITPCCSLASVTTLEHEADRMKSKKKVLEKQQPWVVVKTGQHCHPLCFDYSYLWPVHAHFFKNKILLPQTLPRPYCSSRLPFPCLG